MSVPPTISVLHVDDDRAQCDLVSEVLPREDERIEVATETDPLAAARRIASDPPDCVVSDYEMPELDGLALLERVRAEHPDLPFILFTGQGSESIASEAVSAGVTDYLQKGGGLEQYALLANRVRNAVAQHRAEAAAAEARKRYRALVEAAEDMVFVLDPEGTLEYVSPTAESVTGRSVEALEGTDAFRHVHPEDVDAVRSSVESLAAGETDPVTAEFRYEHADGDYRWFEIKGRNRLDDDLVQGLVGYVRDVTDRKRREARLELYETAVEAMDDGLYVFDADARFVLVNDRAARLAGVEPADWDGRHVEFLVDRGVLAADQARAVESAVRAVAAGDAERRRLEVPLEVPAGPDYVEVRFAPMETREGERRVLAFSRDVTERVERERALRRTEQRYRRLVEQNLVGIYLIRGGEIVYVNPRLAEIFGYDPEELEGKSPLELTAPRDRDRVRENLRERVEGETEAIHYRFAGLTADGEEIEVEVHGGRVDHEGEPAVIGTLRDVTEQERRAAELERQNERLEAFASLVSHDIRNPLSVAAGNVDLAIDEHGPTDALTGAADALERIDELVEDLLALARSGQAVEDVEPVRLDAVARHCWSQVPSGDATLAVEEPPTVRADRARLRQLLENLFRNAVEHGSGDRRGSHEAAEEHGSTSSRPGADDALEHGGGDLRSAAGHDEDRDASAAGSGDATRADGWDHTPDGAADPTPGALTRGPAEAADVAVTVRIGALPDGFYVADDGHGVSPDEREQVFERGFTTRESGSGLGLRIVEEVAEAHGWSVDLVESEQGGARFEFRGVGLPASDGEDEPDA